MSSPGTARIPQDITTCPHLKEEGYPSLNADGQPDGRYTLFVRLDELGKQTLFCIRPNTDEAKASVEAQFRQVTGQDVHYASDGSFFATEGSMNYLLSGVNTQFGGSPIYSIKEVSGIDFGGKHVGNDIWKRLEGHASQTAGTPPRK